MSHPEFENAPLPRVALALAVAQGQNMGRYLQRNTSRRAIGTHYKAYLRHANRIISTNIPSRWDEYSKNSG